MRRHVLTPREASIFACLCDAAVAPAAPLPPVAETDAVAFFDRWLERSPRLNRAALRALLYAAELAPLGLGCGRRLRSLPRDRRVDALGRLERARRQQVRQLAKLVRGMAQLSYYGDDRVLRLVGYDPDANLERGRRLRAAEGRP